MTYTEQHLSETSRIVDALDRAAIDKVVDVLAAVRDRGGRLFFLGVGGSAANCSHAVNDFRKLAGFEAYALQRPRVVISDIAMPDEDGYAMARRIRAYEAEHGYDAPLVALSAFTRSHDKARAREAGFSEYVTKPVVPAELVALIAELAEKRQSAAHG